MPLNAKEFLLADFEGRIPLVNQASNARLWSSQMAPIWGDIISQLESAGDQHGALARKLTREPLVLAPDSLTAEEAYRKWMKDSGLASIYQSMALPICPSSLRSQLIGKALPDKGVS
jgi:hypothetical protein